MVFALLSSASLSWNHSIFRTILNSIKKLDWLLGSIFLRTDGFIFRIFVIMELTTSINKKISPFMWVASSTQMSFFYLAWGLDILTRTLVLLLLLSFFILSSAIFSHAAASHVAVVFWRNALTCVRLHSFRGLFMLFSRLLLSFWKTKGNFYKLIAPKHLYVHSRWECENLGHGLKPLLHCW